MDQTEFLTTALEQIRGARAELAQSAYQDRERMLHEARAEFEHKTMTLAALARNGEPQADEAWHAMQLAHLKFLVLSCGCVYKPLSYAKRWAAQCNQHNTGD